MEASAVGEHSCFAAQIDKEQTGTAVGVVHAKVAEAVEAAGAADAAEAAMVAPAPGHVAVGPHLLAAHAR
jgi:hypothetical protein